MVIFVLLIWLWVWCNAVAGYFVPSSCFPSSFRPLLSRCRETSLLLRSASNDVALDDGSPPSHFISHDDFRSLMKRFSTAGYSRYERRNESVTSTIRTIGFAAAPPTTLDPTATLLACLKFSVCSLFFFFFFLREKNRFDILTANRRDSRNGSLNNSNETLKKFFTF